MALIHESILKILEDIGHISKDRNNPQQGYKFRGIDDVYNAIHPLLARHQVFPTCEVIERSHAERETRNGSAMFFVTLRVKYTLHAVDGSTVTTEAVGEGCDVSDKSANKALSAAYKYALFQLFCIPTEAVDSETETHEVAPKRTDVKYSQKTFENEQPREPYRSPPVHPGPEKRYAEPPREPRKFEEMACPECGETFAVRKSKQAKGGWYCYYKIEKDGKKGCGAEWGQDDPNEGAQVPPKKEKEDLTSFDAWARIILQAPVGSEQAAINVIKKAFDEKKLTKEYVYQIIERASALAMTTQQGEAVESAASALKDACQLPERGKCGWLNFGEMLPVMYDRIEQGGGSNPPF